MAFVLQTPALFYQRITKMETEDTSKKPSRIVFGTAEIAFHVNFSPSFIIKNRQHRKDVRPRRYKISSTLLGRNLFAASEGTLNRFRDPIQDMTVDFSALDVLYSQSAKSYIDGSPIRVSCVVIGMSSDLNAEFVAKMPRVPGLKDPAHLEEKIKYWNTFFVFVEKKLAISEEYIKARGSFRYTSGPIKSYSDMMFCYDASRQTSVAIFGNTIDTLLSPSLFPVSFLRRAIVSYNYIPVGFEIL